jgi:Kelch motif
MTILTIAVVSLGLASPAVAKDSTSRTTPTNGARSSMQKGSAATTGIPAAESGLLPWQLSEPTSREVAVPFGQRQILAVGGLTNGSATTADVAAVAVPTGTSSSVGTLTTPTHDAAGVTLGGRVLIFGGGAQTSVATVQSLSLAGAGADHAVVVGQLPQPRSDAVAVTVGRTVYLIGGYDGSRADAQVLATTNGSSFHVVGTLREPVRYPAAAALGSNIYVFGGERVGTTGSAVDTIQRIDTRNGSISTIGHLPEPVLGASAVTLGSAIYLVGGSTGSADSGSIYAFNPRYRHVLLAGNLIRPVSNAAIAQVAGTAWVLGGESNGTPTADVQMLRPNPKFGLAGSPGAGSPYYGEKLLIADRGNNRLLVLNDTGAITWNYPDPPSMPPPPGPRGFYFPDDAFFFHHGSAIISNQEENETIVEIGYPSGKVLWTFGHPAQAGSSPGYLHEPDDAYMLKNGDVSVSDSDNCRILVISPAGAIVSQVGQTGSCVHAPPTGLGGPNGDTPLADGNFLVSETKGSFISEYTPNGQLVWTTHVAIGYPSDPQQLGPDLYLCADYEDPGGIIEFTKTGQIVYQYRVSSGLGQLNQPSLVELLPSGVFMANDDYRDRMIAIDPTTQATVWDYGVPDVAGTSPGYLNIPDGFDILNADGTTPTHPQTG